jgi:hypothetical protein
MSDPPAALHSGQVLRSAGRNRRFRHAHSASGRARGVGPYNAFVDAKPMELSCIIATAS